MGPAISDHVRKLASAIAESKFNVVFQVVDGDETLGHISVSGEVIVNLDDVTVSVTNAALDQTDETFKQDLLKRVKNAPSSDQALDNSEADTPESLAYHGGSINVSRAPKRARIDK